MRKIEFEVRTTVAERWERTLRSIFRRNLSPRKLESASLDDLIKLAVYAFIAEEAQNEAQAATRMLEEEMDDDK